MKFEGIIGIEFFYGIPNESYSAADILTFQIDDQIVVKIGKLHIKHRLNLPVQRRVVHILHDADDSARCPVPHFERLPHRIFDLHRFDGFFIDDKLPEQPVIRYGLVRFALDELDTDRLEIIFLDADEIQIASDIGGPPFPVQTARIVSRKIRKTLRGRYGVDTGIPQQFVFNGVESRF